MFVQYGLIWGHMIADRLYQIWPDKRGKFWHCSFTCAVVIDCADSMILLFEEVADFCPNPCKYILRDGGSTL